MVLGEKIGFRRKILSLVGLGAVILAFFWAIPGVGSDIPPGSSLNGKKEKPRASSQEVKPKAPGVLLETHQKGGAPAEAENRKAVDPRSIEVIPPDKPGGRGVTQAELDALRASEPQLTDPRSIEVIPPEKPGGRGVTQAELDALKASEARRIDPRLIEVIPPDKPGEPGITQEQLERLQATEREIGIQERKLLPPEENQ